MATYPQQQSTDPLSYEKAPSLSFKDAPVGTVFTGTITSAPKLVQARDFDSGNPKTWPDGNPVMSVVIILDVNGEPRSVWAQKPSSMFAALVAAQKEANAGPMQEGGTLAIKFIGEAPNTKNPKLNPAKQYAARYTPPVAQVDPFGDTPATQPVQAARPASPAARPAQPSATVKGW